MIDLIADKYQLYKKYDEEHNLKINIFQFFFYRFDNIYVRLMVESHETKVPHKRVNYRYDAF